MPGVANEARVILSGTMPKGEIFSTGLSIDTGGGLTQATLQTMTNNFAGALPASTFATFFKANNPNNVIITKVRAEYYAAGSSHAAFSAEAAVLVAGTSSATAVLPNQVAMVATLLTGLAGRSFRGRMYLPVLAPPSTQAVVGDYTNTTVDSAAAAVDGLLDDAEAAYLGPAVVASPVASALTPITNIRVDSRCDTQRRRAASSLVDYTTTVAH